MSALIEARKRAADTIRKYESGTDAPYLAAAVERGDVSAWAAMIEIYLLPAVKTIDALCALRVEEARADGRWE